MTKTKEQDRTIELFRDAPVPKAVINNAIPSIISMIMILLYNMADTLFIGMTKDANKVAAVSIATPAFLLFMAVGMLFGIGGTSMISRLLGEGKKEKSKHASSFCYWTGLVIGIAAMIFIWIFVNPICRLIGASNVTIGLASEYLVIVAVAIPFLIISNAFSNIIRAEGNPKIAMTGMIIGNMMNIVLDPIMILLFGWGIAGAAIATVIGNVFSAVYYTLHMVSKKSILSINPRDYKAGDKIASGVMAIGIPASMNSILMSFSNILINNVIVKYGDMAVAGLGVAMKVNMIVVMLLIGLGNGIQPLLGYCFGSQNNKRYMDVLKFSLWLSFAMSIVMTIICYVFAGPLVTVFLENKEAFDYGFAFSRIYILSGPIMGFLFVFTNAIQSTGAAIPAMILSISRQGLLFIPILFMFSSIFSEARLVALAQPVTDYCAVALSIVLFFFTYKKYFKKKATE